MLELLGGIWEVKFHQMTTRNIKTCQLKSGHRIAIFDSAQLSYGITYLANTLLDCSSHNRFSIYMFTFDFCKTEIICDCIHVWFEAIFATWALSVNRSVCPVQLLNLNQCMVHFTLLY